VSLNRIRALLGILGGLGAGIAIGGIIYSGPTAIGIGIALAAASVLGIDLIRALQAERRKRWQYREQVWARRLR
jgi:hypothetical protein